MAAASDATAQVTSTATATAADERFSWTSELIDAVLALRFKDAVHAHAIGSAKGNEPKRKAWAALTEEFCATRGVEVTEAKIRRAVSKWQSQHRSWVQATATKDPADFTPAERPPSYMPVLHRYFQPDSTKSSQKKPAVADVPAAPAAPSSNPMLSLKDFDAAMTNEPSAQPMVCEPATPSVGNSDQVPKALPSPPASEVTMVPASSSSNHFPATPAEHVTPPQNSVDSVRSPATRSTVIPHDSDEDPATSQEDFQSVPVSTAVGEQVDAPSAKKRKTTPQEKPAPPARPKRFSAAQSVGHASPVVADASVERLAQLRDLATRATQQLNDVHKEQLQLQQKHFEEQIQLHRKQYEEQFTVQRKQVEAFQAVLESLQGHAII